MLITKTFPAFNARRYGNPWGALVKFPNGVKPEYDFTGRWDGDSVVIEAPAGAVVAFGQKDFRGNGTRKILCIVEPNGSLKEVAEAEARAHAASAPEHSQLIAERAKLVARLAEIDAALASQQ